MAKEALQSFVAIDPKHVSIIVIKRHVRIVKGQHQKDQIDEGSRDEPVHAACRGALAFLGDGHFQGSGKEPIEQTLKKGDASRQVLELIIVPEIAQR